MQWNQFKFLCIYMWLNTVDAPWYYVHLSLYQHACWRQRVCHVFYCVNHVTTAKANHVIEQSQSPISLIKSVRFYSWCLCMLWQAIWWIKSDTWWCWIKSALIKQNLIFRLHVIKFYNKVYNANFVYKCMCFQNMTCHFDSMLLT